MRASHLAKKTNQELHFAGRPREYNISDTPRFRSRHNDFSGLVYFRSKTHSLNKTLEVIIKIVLPMK